MLGEPKLKEGMHEIQEKISKMEKKVVEKISEQNSRVETTLKKQETAISSRVFFFHVFLKTNLLSYWPRSNADSKPPPFFSFFDFRKFCATLVFHFFGSGED